MMLLVAIVTGAKAADGDASSTYLNIANYATIDKAGINSGAYKMYGYSENAGKGYLVVSAWEAYKSKGDQTWVTDTGESNQNGAWDATGVFLGSNFYFKKEGSSDKTANSAKTNSSRAYSFKVTNCTEVYSLIKSEKGGNVIMTAYPLVGGARGEAAGSDSDNSKSIATLSITGLNKSTIYEIVVNSDDSKNNLFYEIAFVTSLSSDPSLSVTPATASPFSYVAGNGPSAAQAFTVSLANSTKAVSATLSSTNYEMSKTENGTYSSDAITDLANDSKVYVRLKAGLEKADDYNGTLTFANADVTDDVVVNLSGSVTGQTYAVNYDLNGGSGTASQGPQEAGAKFNLAAAPTKDFSTFNGWLCSADGQTYAAGDEYTMTAAATTFTAQWTGTTYSSTLDFGANAATAPAIATFLAGGNMISSGLTNNSAWENSATKSGFVGFKVKDNNASVKFLAQAGKHVTITLGSVGASFTLKKNGTSETVPAHKGDSYQTVIAFDAEEDVIVEINTTSNSTITLNKIAIEDALASTPVTVGETGFATIGLPYATTIPENVTAYSVSATSETAVTLSSAIAAGTTIPANKGFIIVANPGNYTFNQFANDTWQGDVANKLEATGASAKVAAAAGEFYYFAIINADKKKVGFKKCAANASLAANKAYLPGAGLNANSLSLSFDGETAIYGIAESEANAEAPVKVIKNGKLFIGNYNVAGQQVK